MTKNNINVRANYDRGCLGKIGLTGYSIAVAGDRGAELRRNRIRIRRRSVIAGSDWLKEEGDWSGVR